MTRLRPEDLPAAYRQAHGLDKPSKRSRAGARDGAPCPGRCQCGEEFPNATSWQRHSDRLGAGHRRWSIDLDPQPEQETP